VTTLLDGNVLVALLVAEHVHHRAAEEWFALLEGNFATCPITQGSLLRLLLREGQTMEAAVAVLRAACEDERHEFWPDDVRYYDIRTAGVIGHRQVTDAYLAQLARGHRAMLATFDEGLAAQHADVALLLRLAGQ